MIPFLGTKSVISEFLGNLTPLTYIDREPAEKFLPDQCFLSVNLKTRVLVVGRVVAPQGIQETLEMLSMRATYPEAVFCEVYSSLAPEGRRGMWLSSTIIARIPKSLFEPVLEDIRKHGRKESMGEEAATEVWIIVPEGAGSPEDEDPPSTGGRHGAVGFSSTRRNGGSDGGEDGKGN